VCITAGVVTARLSNDDENDIIDNASTDEDAVAVCENVPDGVDDDAAADVCDAAEASRADEKDNGSAVSSVAAYAASNRSFAISVVLTTTLSVANSNL
jgi:hypothetical protein